MTSFAKRRVSKNNRRFTEDGFDLDLTFITKKIIAMGYPAEGTERLYRNNMKAVQKFLNQRYPGCYRVYNLCSERYYDPQKFFGRVENYPFDENTPPPFPLVQAFCESVQSYIDANQSNIAVIHCTDGRGRTGTMIAALFLYQRMFDDAQDALSFFGRARTTNGEGVTIPSQMRYVHYFNKFLKEHLTYEPAMRMIKGVVLKGIPNIKNGTCVPQIRIPTVHYKSPQYEGIKRDQKVAVLTLPQPVPVSGDVKIEVVHKKGSSKTLFEVWLNTVFIEGGRFYATKSELDVACDDTKNKIFPQRFAVEILFQDVSAASVEKSYPAALLHSGQNKEGGMIWSDSDLTTSDEDDDEWEGLPYSDVGGPSDLLQRKASAEDRSSSAPLGNNTTTIMATKPQPTTPLLRNKETQQRVDIEGKELGGFINLFFNKSANADAESGPLNKVTVVFIGEGRAGKTTTVGSLSGKAFVELVQSTRGADTESVVTVDRIDLANWKEVLSEDALKRAMAALLLAKKSGDKGKSLDDIRALEAQKKQKRRQQQRHMLGHADEKIVSDSSSLFSTSFKPEASLSARVDLKANSSRGDIVASADDDEDHFDESDDDSDDDDSVPQLHSKDFERAITKHAESVLVIQKEGREEEAVALTMRIFDLGGQSTFYVFHAFFITPHAVFPCVFDMESLLDAETSARSLLFLDQWMATLHLYAPGAPILFVGTRGDKVTDHKKHEQVSSILHEHFRDHPAFAAVKFNKDSKLWFWPINNKLSDACKGVQSLRKAITLAATELDMMRLRVPLKWMALYEQLREHNKGGKHPMMTIQEVCRLSAGFGMSDADVRLCFQFLHRLGYLLYFDSVPGMSEYVILDIQWAVDTMTHIIRSFDLHDIIIDEEARRHHALWRALVNEGRLVHKLITVLWKHLDAQLQSAFLDLMVRFGLLMPLSTAAVASPSQGAATTALANVEFLCPHILPFSDRSREHISTWSLSNHAAMATQRYEPASDFRGGGLSTAYIAFSLTPFQRSGDSQMGANCFETVASLRHAAFVPEGLFGRVVGMLVAMNAGKLASKARITRTQCMIVIGEIRLLLSLVPAIGSIRVQTSANRPALVLRMVSDTINTVCKDAYSALHFLSLLPYNEVCLLHYDEVVRAARTSRSVFLDMVQVGVGELREKYQTWLPSKGQLDSYDVFISYRQAVNSQFALSMHGVLGELQHVVFLDEYNLELGQDFKIAFMKSICSSVVVCPLVSAGALSRMISFSETNDFCDNVLLEWWCASLVSEIIESVENGTASADVVAIARKIKTSRVMPLILSNTWSNDNVPKSLVEADSFGDLVGAAKQLPDVVSHETLSELQVFCRQYFSPSYVVEPRTVRHIVTKLFNFNALECWDAAKKQSRIGHGSQVSFEESAKLDKKGRISFYARHIHDLVVTAKSKSAASVASMQTSPASVRALVRPMREWTFEELKAWLEGNMVGFAVAPLRDIGINGEVFVGLTESELIEDLGLKRLQARSVISRRNKHLSSE